MRKNYNQLNIEGKIYQSELEIKTVQNTESANYGKEYISGTIDVATSPELDNIISVHYTYVTATTKNGSPNRTYAGLKQIMDSGKTVTTDGWDEATVVRVQPSYAVNDFYPQGQEELVTSPKNEGGFITIVSNEKSLHPVGDINRNKFTLDVILNNVTEVVPEEGESYAKIEGITFDFRNAILPITLVARNKAAIEYFVGLDISKNNPVYTKVWGKIINTFVTTEKTVESAFGEATVDTVQRRVREYVITGANPIPYEMGSEDTITVEEFKKAQQDREVYLAEVKRKSEEYWASQNVGGNFSEAAPAKAAVPKGGFNF